VDAGRQTVLVVEDEPLILFSIADELREAGFNVLEAQNAEEALRLLEENDDIRLIFTDIDMPGSMDGLRFSAVVRERWPPVCIIVTSGKRVPDADALPSGSEFVPKPYTPHRVVQAMHSMLA
jgi:two-component system, response regulator PdtaR